MTHSLLCLVCLLLLLSTYSILHSQWKKLLLLRMVSHEIRHYFNFSISSVKSLQTIADCRRLSKPSGRGYRPGCTLYTRNFTMSTTLYYRQCIFSKISYKGESFVFVCVYTGNYKHNTGCIERATASNGSRAHAQGRRRPGTLEFLPRLLSACLLRGTADLSLKGLSLCRDLAELKGTRNPTEERDVRPSSGKDE